MRDWFYWHFDTGMHLLLVCALLPTIILVWASGAAALPLVALWKTTSAPATQVGDSLRSGLSLLPVRFVVVGDPVLDDGTPLVVQAEDVIRRHGVQLIVFFDESDTIQFVWYHENGFSQMVRPLVGTGTMSRLDVAALVVSTTVQLLLETGELYEGASVSSRAPVRNEERTNRPHAVKKGSDIWRSLQLGYVQSVRGSGPTMSPGGIIGGELTLFRHGFVFVQFGVMAPLVANRGHVEVTLREVPIVLGGGVEGRFFGWRLDGAVGALLSPVRFSAVTLDRQVALKAPYWKFDAGVVARTRFTWELGSILGVYLELNVVVRPGRLVVQVANGPSFFDDFWRLAPGFGVGLAILGP